MNDIKPIRTEDDYKAACDQVSRLFGARKGTPEGDRLEVLLVLVDAYQRKRYPAEPVDPVDLLEFRLDQGLPRPELAELVGGRGKLSEVLNRKRRLSISMIRELHKRYAMPLEVLMTPYPLAKAKTKPAKAASKARMGTTSSRKATSTTTKRKPAKAANRTSA